MPRVQFNVALTLTGPVLTHSSAMGLHGLDAVMAKRGGTYFLPRTLVKGKLREAWERLSHIDPTFGSDLSRWMGEATGNRQEQNKDWSPIRGELQFSDFRAAPGSGDDSRVSHRIAIDRERGSVTRGSLLVMESPWAAGETVTFSGTVRVTGTDEEVARLAGCLEAGFRWIQSFGAERTAGFGRVSAVGIEQQPWSGAATGSAAETVAGSSIGLVLTPDEPFLIAKRRVADNVFESEQFITGAAIKGAMASMLNAAGGKPLAAPVTAGTASPFPSLCRWFEKVRITHAFPGQGGARAVYPPESLVRADGKTFDVALLNSPALVLDQAPAFQVDWKPADYTVYGGFGWPVPQTEVRVRTAIDRESGRAKDEALFAYDMAEPKEGVRWQSKIVLPGECESEWDAIKLELSELLREGLFGVGKTKVRCGVEFSEPAGAAAPMQGTAPVSGRWIVTLQTPALLCDAGVFEGSPGQGRAGRRDLAAAYQAGLNKAAKAHVFELERFFARQTLAGGAYLYMRRQRPAGERGYRPWLLTQAGSVFVLKPAAGIEAEAQRTIEDWVKHGIPGAEDWRRCPYTRENGYGEIVVNLACHLEWRPKEGEYRYV